MINLFTTKNKVCHSHFLPLTFLCSDPLCPATDMLCSHCISRNHPHLSHIHTLPQFSTHLRSLISSAQLQYTEDKYAPSLSQAIKNKKQEIQSIQLMLLEQLTKRLAEEKQRIFNNLEQLERTLMEQELAFTKNHAMRQELLQYLTPYTHNLELLELKLRTSNRWGLARLKENIQELQNLSANAKKRQIEIFQQRIAREINLTVDLSLFKSIRQCLREQKRQNMPNSMEQLQLRKDWPIMKRGQASTRPNSSVQFKPRSIQSSRRSQSRSNVLL